MKLINTKNNKLNNFSVDHSIVEVHGGLMTQREQISSDKVQQKCLESHR